MVLKYNRVSSFAHLAVNREKKLGRLAMEAEIIFIPKTYNLDI